MPLSARRWKQLTESRYAHEREALEFLRDALPDRDPIFVYSNFEFIADDGTVNEIDALIVTQAGVFLVELKSRAGFVAGNRHLWDWTKDGHTITIDSPLTLTNAKARKLASLLSKQPAFRSERSPWIEPLVFLSAPGISVRLPESERMRICEREPRDKKPGILPALLTREYFGNESARSPYLALSDARRVAKALDEAGIRPSPRQRRVGDYVLKELIEENPLFAYQDFQAEHPTTKATRRVRLYNVSGKDKAALESVRRAALQEFQTLDQLDHPGILRALDFTEHELGPAILFRREPTEVRLDHFLRQRESSLTLDLRLNLVRQIAEAVRYAHKHRVIHRTLSPKSILVVNPDSDHPEVRICNWQTSRLVPTGSTSPSPASRTSTLHPSQYSEESTLCYLAPELSGEARGRDPMSDIFSLGAVAFHIFSGRPPANTPTELTQLLNEHKGLPLAAVLDGAASGLQDLVHEATSPDLLLRTETVADFIENLDKAEEKLTAPPQDELADPLLAKAGDPLPHKLNVIRRLGGGTSAVALLVQRGDDVLVLKYARDPKDNARIEKEHQIMLGLRDELIVRADDLLEFPNGHKGFLMEYAGEWDRKRDVNEPRDTLARELKAVGRLSLDFLGRFGEDLLKVVQYLEDKGVAHRDLKPDNIGIKEYAKKLHLKVFDFSLSSAPLDNVRVGTPPYLEPFLQLRKRWDTAAERYSAAVILYEMATGTTPRWGDGQSAAHLIDNAEVTIDADLFDAPIRQDLNDFFRTCFRRDPINRFDNAADMLLAWQNIFHRANASESQPPDVVAQEKALETLTPETLLSQLGISTRAQNTLDRQSIFTAQDLAAQSPGKFSNLRGVGHKTRREIMDLIGKLRSKLPMAAIPERTTAEPSTEPNTSGESPSPPSIDALVALLIPVESSPSGKVSRQILAQFLELEAASNKAASPAPQYPTQSQLAAQSGKTRAQIGQIITKARDRWRRSVPQLTPVRNELAGFMEAEGGVAHISELTQFLLANRGSIADPDLATRRAAAVVRAALEAEKPSESCRFAERRHADLFLIARAEPPFAEAALDYAEKLAEAGKELAKADPLPSPARVLESLRAIPTTIPALRDDRLIRLAAAHPEVAVSPRLELYPRNLDSLRALKLAQSSLAGLTELTAYELRSRVRDRYPEAQPLPVPPELDRLVDQASLGLKRTPNSSIYVAPSTAPRASSTSFHHAATITSPTPSPLVAPVEKPREIQEALEFERRLQLAYRSPSYLVLATDPKFKQLSAARQHLGKHFPMDTFHCEREFLAALRKEAQSLGVRWEVLLRADSAKPQQNGEASRDWENLKKLAAKAARHVADQLRGRKQSTLVLYPGMLARYGQLSILEELADSIGDHSLWLLAASDHQAAAPLIDGQAIPARSTQWAWIPRPWLENDFRNFRGGSAA